MQSQVVFTPQLANMGHLCYNFSLPVSAVNVVNKALSVSEPRGGLEDFLRQ